MADPNDSTLSDTPASPPTESIVKKGVQENGHAENNNEDAAAAANEHNCHDVEVAENGVEEQKVEEVKEEETKPTVDEEDVKLTEVELTTENEVEESKSPGLSSLSSQSSGVANTEDTNTEGNNSEAATSTQPPNNAESGFGGSEATLPTPDSLPSNYIPISGAAMLQPATKHYACERNGAVKLRMGTNGIEAETPTNIVKVFQDVTGKAPKNLAMVVKRDGNRIEWNYDQFYKDVVKAGKAFIKLGVKPFDGVGILGFNSPEWAISHLGAIFCGGLAVGMYTTNTAEACHYVAEHSEAAVIVVENDSQLQKILEIRDRLPNLKAIVQYIGSPKANYPNVYTWSQFLELSANVSDEQLNERMSKLAANQCCTLIYTSGTTGNPKGVMLSHDNVTFCSKATIQHCGFKFGQERCVSFLPLSHIAAQLVDIFIMITCGGTVFYAQPDALKGSLGITLKEARPTAMFAVPRVWEKFQDKIKETGRSTTGFKKKVAVWAKGVGLHGNYSKMNGQLRKRKGGSTPWGWSIAKALVFNKVRAALGLDQCRIVISGAAPISKETLEFFMSLDIVITETYGMSESSGPHTISLPNVYKLGTVGKEMGGVYTKLDHPDADGNGEICMRGRHVLMGYLNEEEKTLETVDNEGWLHTGDIGKKDDDGFLQITGRIKELIITAGGENVAPVPIEDQVKVHLPVVSNCMLVGDRMKFLSMLITLKTVVDVNTMEPTDELTMPAQDWFESIGMPNTTSLSAVLKDKSSTMLQAIQAGIDKANDDSISRAQKIQKWSILPRDFSTPGGELGPTMKLRRPIVVKMYENTIENFYE